MNFKWKFMELYGHTNNRFIIYVVSSFGDHEVVNVLEIYGEDAQLNGDLTHFVQKYVLARSYPMRRWMN